jgi:hypothetical protein
MAKSLDPDRIIMLWMRILITGSRSGFATLKGAQQAADAFSFFWLPIKKKKK